jgi:acyl-CoA synthetase (AMP-forming)/AMP-acid ligase II
MSAHRDSIRAVLREGRQRSASGIALRFRGETVSYPELEERVRRCALSLLAMGLQPGEKVALSLPNDPAYPVAFFGVQWAGGVVVPTNPHLTARERRFVLEHSDARWLIVPEGQAAPPGSEEVPTLEGLLRIRRDGSLEGTREVAADLPGEDAEAEGILIYTSGTTGHPKGVLLTQKNIVANARSVVSYLGLGPRDRHVVFLPLFYSYAMSQMLSTLLAGGEILLLEGLLYPQMVLEEIARQGGTVLAGVPTTYNLLVRLEGFRSSELRDLRLFLNAGGPIHPDRLEDVRSRFPQAKIINNYGCTEAGPRVTYLPHEELHRRGSIGIPIPGMSVVLRDEAGRRIGPGELGEIYVTGPSVMKGYYKNEVETRRVLTPFGLRTGDWATLDKDGFLYFKGRKVDIINTGGEKVSAREVEEVLLQHPGVKEVAVVGSPDPILGEVVKAFVVPETEGGVTEEELASFAAGQLAPHKIPRRFKFCKSLARTASGKIRKVDLIG